MGVRASFGSWAPVVPGETAGCELTVENTGVGPQDVRMELVGEAAAWGWITPPLVTLAPGGRTVARVTLKLPRAPEPAAGPVLVTASMVVASTPEHPQAVSATIDVAPFVDVSAALDPHTSRGRVAGRHTLTVANKGNVRLSAAVEVEADELSMHVEPDRVDVDPGQSATVDVTARAHRRPFRARTTTRNFEVLVQPDGQGPPARAQGGVELTPAAWKGRAAAVLVVLAVVAVALRAVVPSSSGGDGGDEPPEAASAESSACPGRDHLSPDANGVVRPDVRPARDYTFLFVDDGCRPARFNPCAPVRYTLNRSLASDADVADLREALRKTEAATGLEFQYAGPSDENPLTTPRPVRAADGTLTWPPVLIGWAHLGSGEGLRPRDGPRGDRDAVVGGGGRPLVVENVITTGNLVLNLDAVTDTDTNRPVPRGFGTGVNWGRIMLHELAHVIGLGHVESRTSIMNEALTQQTISSAEWGVGDLIGLRHLGRDSGCLDVPRLQLRGAS